MGVIATIRFSGEELPILDALAAAPGMRLEVEQAIAKDPNRPQLFVWAEGAPFDDFEDALADDPTAAAVDALEDVGTRRLYRIQVSESAGTVLYPADVEVGASRLAVTATADGIDARIRFPDRDALAEYLDICRDAGATVTLRRLYRSDDAAAGEYGLPEKQREALRAAADRGYFEVPRRSDLNEVAAELGVSTQSASERVRRGVDRLLENTIRDAELDEGAMYGR